MKLSKTPSEIHTYQVIIYLQQVLGLSTHELVGLSRKELIARLDDLNRFEKMRKYL